MTRLAIVLFLCCLTIQLYSGTPGWKRIQPLAEQRIGHNAVMVHTGDVVVFGGANAAGIPLATCFVQNGVSTQRVATINTMAVARMYATCVVVHDAQGISSVYAIGGYTGSAGNYSSSAVVEVLRFSATTNTWRWETISPLPTAAAECAATWDGLDHIIVTGGYAQTGGNRATGTQLNVSCRINIRNGSVQTMGNMATARAQHGTYTFADQTTNNAVLTAGGEPTLPQSTELLAGTTWDTRANPPRAYRKNGVPVSDISGTARIFGGNDENGVPMATTESYDPKSGWRPAPRMSQARSASSATLVAGPVDTAQAYIVVAGQSTTGAISGVELFRMPTQTTPTGAFETFDALNVASKERVVTMTGVNLPMVVGGFTTLEVEVYQPLRSADVNFPATEVGSQSDSIPVVVTNTWILPVDVRSVRVVGDPDFLVAVDTTIIKLASGASRGLVTFFRPTQQGVRTAKIILDMGPVADTLTLTGNGVASTIAVLTNAVDYGSVQVLKDSVQCFTLLKNNGTDTSRVDSIIVTPANAFRIISPTGRTFVAPGDSLVVCIAFSPRAQGGVAGSATVAIGPKRFPAALTGRGIRTKAIIQPQRDCDTLDGKRLDVITVGVTVENTGDRPVTLTGTTIQTPIVGVFVFDQSVVFPFTLQPAEVRVLNAQFTIQREGTERVGISFDSNSDTLMQATYCYVVKSKGIDLSAATIDVGQLCAGDSVTREVTISNVSTSETIVFDSVGVDNAPGSRASITALTILPRSSQTIRTTYKATATGAVTGSVQLYGATSATSIPFTGTIKPGIVISIPSRSVFAGEQIVLDVQAAGTFGNTLEFELLHSPSVISITTITANVPTGTVSMVKLNQRGTGVSIPFTGVPTQPITLQLQVEALRSADTVTTLRAVSIADGSCVSSDTATMFIAPPCGGEGSLLRFGKGASVSVNPTPALHQAVATIYATQDMPFTVQVVNALGLVVQEYSVAPCMHAEVPLNINTMPSGVYDVRIISRQTIMDNHVLRVLR